MEINVKHEKIRRFEVIANISLVMTLSTFLLFGLQAKTVKAQDWKLGSHKLLGLPAPELELSEWIRGESKTLEELKGEVVLLDIFQIICPGCHAAHPRIVEFQERYKKQGLEVLGVAVAFEYQFAQTPDHIKKYVKAKAYPYPVAIDLDMTATFRKYQSGGTPWTVLIDRLGKVRYIGFFRGREIEAMIKRLIAEQSVGTGEKEGASVGSLAKKPVSEIEPPTTKRKIAELSTRQLLCPLMGEEIDKKYYVDHNEKRIYVCCAGCVKIVKKKPSKFIKQLESQGIELENIGRIRQTERN